MGERGEVSSNALGVTKFQDKAVQLYDPDSGAMRVHAAESAERAAKRTKNVEAFERAVQEKLEAQRDFAADFKGRYPHGGDRQSNDFQDASTGALKPLEHCKKHGFALRTVQRWCERLLDEAKFHVELHQRLAKVWSIVEMEQAANYSSESVEWYTPEEYIELVRDCLGAIDLDPASSAQANKTVKAKKFWIQATKPAALTRKWFGRVFMNPPYGKTDGNESLAGVFCAKAISEYEAGNVKEAILLINSLHSQSWQAPFYDHAICFVDHRIQFVSGDGEVNKNPTFQNIFVYLGEDRGKFASVFDRVGYVMEKVR